MKLPINYDESSFAKRREARDLYVEMQGGNCYHCGRPLNEMPSLEVKRKSINKMLFPKNFFKWPVHLHHDHSTGLTIGAVHNKCNAVLWQYYGE